ncbi:flagellar export protein FliJ [Paenibacillus taiwanensis]|uniref:flagellar export protein FliJ n=1 Tax=Paenibacillus taiwanensis TaxID=401638 RepID=UPI0004159CBF|nr:flagellar export protein FliJ [Paenibacillus taiwanensis]
MRAFQYSFQKVLDLKTNTKKQSEWMLSEAIGHLQTEEDQLLRVKNERKEAADTLQRMIDSSAPAHELQLWQHYIAHMDSQIFAAHERVLAAEGRVRVRQDNLKDCMTDEKLWKKAREKAEDHFKQQLALIEQNEMDEMATVRFHMATR